MIKLTLIEKKQETADVESFIFKTEEPLTWLPGQYLRYRINDLSPDERGNNRFFTISSAPFEQYPMITTRLNKEKSSSFKNYLQELEVGGSIEADGPKGSFTVDDPQKQYVFIAGGIGITPYRSILLDLDHNKKPINITLIYGNRDENIAFKDVFEDIAKRNPNFKIHYILDPQRIDKEIIKSLVPDLQTPIFYFSGPEPMVAAIKQQVIELGVPEDHTKTDYFPGYEN